MTAYRRRTDVLWRRSPHAVLVLGLDDGAEVVRLDGTGVVLWELLEDEATLDELARLLAEAYGADEARVRDDLAPVLDDLARRGLLVEAS